VVDISSFLELIELSSDEEKLEPEQLELEMDEED